MRVHNNLVFLASISTFAFLFGCSSGGEPVEYGPDESGGWPGSGGMGGGYASGGFPGSGGFTTGGALTGGFPGTGGMPGTGGGLVGTGGAITGTGGAVTGTGGVITGTGGVITGTGGVITGTGGVITGTGGVITGTGGVITGTGGVITGTGGVITGTGGVITTTGGTTGTGGGSSTATMATQTGGGLVESAPFSGYAWTATESPSLGSTISPVDFSTLTAGQAPCASGTVVKDAAWGGVAMLGINVAQVGETAADWTPTGTGICLNVTNPGASPLRIQVQSAAGTEATRWCATLPSTGGCFDWADLTVGCWAAGGAEFDPATDKISAVLVIVPGSNTAAVPFNFCVTGLSVQP